MMALAFGPGRAVLICGPVMVVVIIYVSIYASILYRWSRPRGAHRARPDPRESYRPQRSRGAAAPPVDLQSSARFRPPARAGALLRPVAGSGRPGRDRSRR